MQLTCNIHEKTSFFSVSVHLWRYEGGYPALNEVMSKLRQNKVKRVDLLEMVNRREHRMVRAKQHSLRYPLLLLYVITICTALEKALEEGLFSDSEILTLNTWILYETLQDSQVLCKYWFSKMPGEFRCQYNLNDFSVQNSKIALKNLNCCMVYCFLLLKRNIQFDNDHIVFKEFTEFRKERGNMLLSRKNQLLLEFSFWNEPVPREGPNIYELRSYQLRVSFNFSFYFFLSYMLL